MLLYLQLKGMKMQEEDANFVTSQNPSYYINKTRNMTLPSSQFPYESLHTYLLTRILTCLLNYLLTHSHTHYKFHIL